MIERIASSIPAVAPAPRPRAASAAGPGFGDTLGRALDGLNRLQHDAHQATLAVARGDRVNMTDALLSVEKANISFQFALQVRNKLLEAYQDIMRMQV